MCIIKYVFLWLIGGFPGVAGHLLITMTIQWPQTAVQSPRLTPVARPSNMKPKVTTDQNVGTAGAAPHQQSRRPSTAVSSGCEVYGSLRLLDPSTCDWCSPPGLAFSSIFGKDQSCLTIPSPGPVTQTFHWLQFRWDIGQVLLDIQAATLAPQRIELGHDFIERYATRVLGLRPYRKPEAGAGGLLMAVDLTRRGPAHWSFCTAPTAWATLAWTATALPPPVAGRWPTSAAKAFFDRGRGCLPAARPSSVRPVLDGRTAPQHGACTAQRLARSGKTRDSLLTHGLEVAKSAD